MPLFFAELKSDPPPPAYPDEYIRTRLGEPKPEWVEEIQDIGRTYLRNRASEYDKSWRKQSLRSYRSFSNVTAAFLNRLTESYEDPDFFNIPTEMLMMARQRDEPTTQQEFSKLTAHQRQVEAHYWELVRLTELLQATLSRGIEKSKSKPGPRSDFALEHLVISSAEFWTVQLRRKFTVDYHKSSGLTEAFKFVQWLIKPLDSVDDKSIITAMRTEITKRRAQKSRKSIIRKKRHIKK